MEKADWRLMVLCLKYPVKNGWVMVEVLSILKQQVVKGWLANDMGRWIFFGVCCVMSCCSSLLILFLPDVYLSLPFTASLPSTLHPVFLLSPRWKGEEENRKGRKRKRGLKSEKEEEKGQKREEDFRYLPTVQLHSKRCEVVWPELQDVVLRLLFTMIVFVSPLSNLTTSQWEM